MKIPVYRPSSAAFAATDPAEGAESQKRGSKPDTAAFPAESCANSITAFTHIATVTSGVTARISGTGSVSSVQYQVITISASGRSSADRACEGGWEP